MLSVIFDRRLTWSLNIEYLKKINNQFIKNNKNTITWDVETKTLIKIHKSMIIQSKLNYGASLNRTTSKYLLKSIDNVNNSGLRLD